MVSNLILMSGGDFTVPKSLAVAALMIAAAVFLAGGRKDA